jgi:chemotaxis protein MotB
MQNSGLQEQQVSQVRGFADQRPRAKTSADDPTNRRISLIVEYHNKEANADDTPGAQGVEGKTSSGSPAAVEHGGAKQYMEQ